MLAALILLTSMLGSIILALSTTEKTTDTSSLASITPPSRNKTDKKSKFMFRACNSMVEYTAHNGQVIGSNPIKLTIIFL
jgi:hypothetical protein